MWTSLLSSLRTETWGNVNSNCDVDAACLPSFTVLHVNHTRQPQAACRVMDLEHRHTQMALKLLDLEGSGGDASSSTGDILELDNCQNKT